MSFNSIKSAMQAASSGMNAQSFRMRVVSENLSNADTHGYQRKQVSFKNEVDRLSRVCRASMSRMCHWIKVPVTVCSIQPIRSPIQKGMSSCPMSI